MKIDPGIKQVKPPSPVEKHSTQAPANTSTKIIEATEVDVTLGSRAEQLKELETRLASIPLVDQARVDSIKEAIVGGRYTLNIENIADALIRSVKEMLHVAR